MHDKVDVELWLQSPEAVQHFYSWFLKATGMPGEELKYRRTAERALASLPFSSKSSKVDS
jgi:hypothetical protein